MCVCVCTVSFFLGFLRRKSRYCLLSPLMSCRKAWPCLRSANLSSSSAFSFCSSHTCLSALIKHTVQRSLVNLYRKLIRNTRYWTWHVMMNTEKTFLCWKGLLLDYRETDCHLFVDARRDICVFELCLTSLVHIWHPAVCVSLNVSKNPPDTQGQGQKAQYVNTCTFKSFHPPC